MKYNLICMDVTLWREIVENNPSATFFHTPAWMEIFCRTFPKWENATFGIEFEDGNRAVFPLMRRQTIRGIRSYWHESMAPGVYGGPIFEFDAGSEHYSAINEVLSGYNNLLICSNPFSNWSPEGRFNQYETFIQVVRLEPDFGKIWKNYSKGRRHTVNFASKKGVVVREVDFFENYQAYFDIYCTQLKRWGQNATNHYPKRLFESIGRYSRINPNIKLWTAWLNDKMISGLIVFYHRKHLVTWHGATLEQYFEFRPVDILYSKVIENACAAGREIFDFTNSGGHENVVFYKERFGSVRLPMKFYKRRNMSGLVYRAERYFRTLTGKCPED